MILAALAAAGLGACAAAIGLTLAGSQSSNPVLDAEIRATIIAAPIAVGLYAWYREPWARFGKLLVAAGFAWSLTTLAESSNEVLYSSGRVLGWLVEPFLIYLVLGFPSGRVKAPIDRFLVAGGVSLVALLYLPTMLLVDSYPSPSPWNSCDTNCPANAFMLLGSEPGFVGSVVVPLREVAAVFLFAGVIAVLFTRSRRGTHLMRITLLPVLVFAILHAAGFLVGLVTRHAIDYTAAEVAAWVVAISVPGIALGFLVGLLRWRRFENLALRRLPAAFASHPPAFTMGETEELLSATFDPSLEILRRPAGEAEGWLDLDDEPVKPPSKDRDRCVTRIPVADGSTVAVVHDVALSSSPALLDVTRSSVLQAIENERLGGELRRSLRELRASRARLISSADRERHRIEQDLHDGAQQTLVALRIRLDLVSQLLRRTPGRAEELLSELVVEVDSALDEIRSLARGVYPSLLAERGLSEALRAAARRSPVWTTVDVDGVGRYPQGVEAAIYFCCLEAMQNAMKHAAGVATISVFVAVRDDLHFEVHDDGCGFVEEDVTSGDGLSNMRDRLAAVGGLLTIRTSPGEGTVVSGVVPLSANGSAGHDVTLGGGSAGLNGAGGIDSPPLVSNSA